ISEQQDGGPARIGRQDRVGPSQHAHAVGSLFERHLKRRQFDGLWPSAKPQTECRIALHLFVVARDRLTATAEETGSARMLADSFTQLLCSLDMVHREEDKGKIGLSLKLGERLRARFFDRAGCLPVFRKCRRAWHDGNSSWGACRSET